MLDYVNPKTGEVIRVENNQDLILKILEEGGEFRLRELSRKTGLNKRRIAFRYLDSSFTKKHDITIIGIYPKLSYELNGQE